MSSVRQVAAHRAPSFQRRSSGGFAANAAVLLGPPTTTAALTTRWLPPGQPGGRIDPQAVNRLRTANPVDAGALRDPDVPPDELAAI